MSFLFKKIWVLVKFWFISQTINSCKQWTNDNCTKLHTFLHEQILFLPMTLFKLVASNSGEKVADFSEQCSRRVSSVVGAHWNPWASNRLQTDNILNFNSPQHDWQLMMAFLTGQSWHILKSWYTGGDLEQGFQCFFTDRLNQRFGFVCGAGYHDHVVCIIPLLGFAGLSKLKLVIGVSDHDR